MPPAVAAGESRIPSLKSPSPLLCSHLIVLALAMAGLILVVPPGGDFPIDIDWNYSWVVRSLLDGRQVAASPWTAASLVLQVYWGGLFSAVFGFSQTTLRVSTLVLGAAAVVAMYLLLREIVEREWALIGALLLLFNPLFVPLAYSFKTNVPLLAFALWALYCDVRALRGSPPDVRWLVAGSIFAGAAYLVRQIGVALPPAVLATLGLAYGWRAALRWRQLATVIGPFMLAAMIGAYFDHQRGSVKQDPVAWMVAYWTQLGPDLAAVVVARVLGAFTTLGLLTLPLSLGVLADRSRSGFHGWQRQVGFELPLALAAGSIAGSIMFSQWPLFPYLGDTLDHRGFFVENHYYHDGTVPRSILIPDWALIIVTAASLVGGALLLLATIGSISRDTLRRPTGVVLLFGLLALGLSLVYHTFHDDYLLAILPTAMVTALLAYRKAHSSRVLAVAGVVICAVWSVWWERDLLQREGAVWKAGQELVARGIPPDQIDGGFPWNGWYRGQAVIAAAIEPGQASGPGPELQSRIFDGLHMLNAPWVITFALPDESSGGNVLAVVEYGRGFQVFAVQRGQRTGPQRSTELASSPEDFDERRRRAG